MKLGPIASKGITHSTPECLGILYFAGDSSRYATAKEIGSRYSHMSVITNEVRVPFPHPAGVQPTPSTARATGNTWTNQCLIIIIININNNAPSNNTQQCHDMTDPAIGPEET